MPTYVLLSIVSIVISIILGFIFKKIFKNLDIFSCYTYSICVIWAIVSIGCVVYVSF